jgi:hypothetical protein
MAGTRGRAEFCKNQQNQDSAVQSALAVKPGGDGDDYPASYGRLVRFCLLLSVFYAGN